MKRSIILTALCCLVLVGAAVGQQRKLVGNIKGETGGGCGEFFTFAGQSVESPNLMFYSSAGDETETWMNIDGKDVRLKFVSRSEPTKIDARGAELKGSRTIEKYVASQITVEIILTVAWRCPKSDENCESVGYNAIFKVRKGKIRQILKAEGISGC